MTEDQSRQRRDRILSPDFAVTEGAEGRPLIGVLALQGDFREHRAVLERIGAQTCEVRRPEHLQGLDGLVIPGGESTTIAKLMLESGLFEAIRTFSARGGVVYGTCAGLISVACETVEGGQATLGLIDIVARRNAFGRQVRSFETPLSMPALGPAPLTGVFIRAPWIESAGPSVEVLASVSGHGVAARQGDVLVTAFHPELTDDHRVHEHFLHMVRRSWSRAEDRSVGQSTREREGVVP
jgi:5'-phosphate synthase pdxT subunit